MTISSIYLAVLARRIRGHHSIFTKCTLNIKYFVYRSDLLCQCVQNNAIYFFIDMCVLASLFSISLSPRRDAIEFDRCDGKKSRQPSTEQSLEKEVFLRFFWNSLSCWVIPVKCHCDWKSKSTSICTTHCCFEIEAESDLNAIKSEMKLDANKRKKSNNITNIVNCLNCQQLKQKWNDFNTHLFNWFKSLFRFVEAACYSIACTMLWLNRVINENNNGMERQTTIDKSILSYHFVRFHLIEPRKRSIFRQVYDYKMSTNYVAIVRKIMEIEILGSLTFSSQPKIISYWKLRPCTMR